MTRCGRAGLLALLAGCGGQLPVSQERQPKQVRQPGAFGDWPVGESSGVIASRTMPGRFWTLNDSGNAPSLFSFDSTGDRIGFVDLRGSTNVDWEAISAGPCGPSWCLYVADIGDNSTSRPSVTIYRTVEPDRQDLAAHRATVLDSLVVRYPDGPRDAEALVVTDSGDVAIITKGRESVVTAFWIPASAWADGRTVARPVWTVPITPSIIHTRLVTDAALSTDGATLAVRTYREIYLFTRTPESRWLPDRPAGGCEIGGLEPQGEGIAWASPTTFILTSEILVRSPAPITFLECPPQ